MNTIEITSINVESNVIEQIKRRKDDYVSGMLCRNIGYNHAGFMSWMAVKVMNFYNTNKTGSFEVSQNIMASSDDVIEIKKHNNSFIANMKKSDVPEEVINHMKATFERGLSIIESQYKEWKESQTKSGSKA